MIKSGNTTLDPMAVKDLSKDKLELILKGRIAEPFCELWVKICKANGNEIESKKVENESSIKPSIKSKKS
jgi:hypothetical protein